MTGAIKSGISALLVGLLMYKIVSTDLDRYCVWKVFCVQMECMFEASFIQWLLLGGVVYSSEGREGFIVTMRLEDVVIQQLRFRVSARLEEVWARVMTSN